jgi:integrase
MKGHVRERGKGNWYAVLSVRDQTGKRKVQWRALPDCKGKREAQIECSRLIGEIADGSFVVSNTTTLAEWIDHWLSIGAPGKKRQAVGNRSLERYGDLLRVHVKPALGHRPLQKLQSTEIDTFYVRLEGKISARTARHVHNVLNACLGTAARTRKITRNPMLDVIKIPSPGEPDHGIALDSEQLRTLVQGFRGSVFFPIIAVAAFTGARRNEVLALRWEDFDPDAKTLRIERAIEETRQHGLQIKGPKTERGKRTIEIDDDLVALLRAERDRALRIVAGVPTGAAVDLSLVKLPEDALMFPCPPMPGEQFSFTKLRKPRLVSWNFKRKAVALGFDKLRLHDLRGTHETLLLDAGVPVHVVAARCGHDPAVLLRSYAKRTRKADRSAAGVIGAISRGVLGTAGEQIR